MLGSCTTPVIGRLVKRSWRLFPETVPAALVGPDLPDRRLRNSVRWFVVLHVVSVFRVADIAWLKSDQLLDQWRGRCFFPTFPAGVISNKTLH